MAQALGQAVAFEASKELDFKELDFKELGVLGYLLGVLGYLLGVPI